MIEPQQSFEFSDVAEQHDFIFALAHRVARGHEAEDVAQDSILSAARSARPRDRDDLRNWLARVVRNVASKRARSFVRRRAHEIGAASDGPTEDPLETITRSSAARSLQTCLLRLDERYRQPIRMRYFDGLPPREIAQHLGVPVDTVHTRLRRGLEQLRGELDARHGGRDAWLGALLWTSTRAPRVAPDPRGSSLKHGGRAVAVAALLVATTLTFAWSSGRADVAPSALAPSRGLLVEAEATPGSPATSSRPARTSVAAPRRTVTLLRDLDRRPIVGARVTTPQGDEQVSDASGRVHVDDARRGMRIDGTARSLGATLRELPLVELDDGSTEILVRAASTVAGTVLGFDAKPVARAEVLAFEGSPPRFADGAPIGRVVRAHTGADGSFLLGGVEPGAWVTVVRHGVGSTDVLQLAPRARDYEDVRLTLRPTRTIRGRVVDVEGRPRANVRVVAHPIRTRQPAFSPHDPTERRLQWGELEARTDARGEFVVEDVSALDVSVSARDASEIVLGGADCPAGRDEPIVITAGRPLRCEVRVLDGSDRPIEGARVSVLAGGSPLRRPAVSGADGRASFEQPWTPVPWIVLEVTAEGIGSTRLGPLPRTGASTQLVARLRPPDRVHVRAIDAQDRPVSGARLEARAETRTPAAADAVSRYFDLAAPLARAVADDEGDATFTSDGRALLVAWIDPSTRDPIAFGRVGSGTLVLRPGDRGPSGRTFRAHVRSDGRAGAIVALHAARERKGSPAENYVFTAETGSTIEGLLPDRGPWDLAVVHEGHGVWARYVADLDEIAELVVDLRTAAGAGLRIVDAQGAPVPGACVQLGRDAQGHRILARGGERFFVDTFVADGAGRVELHDLPASSCAFSVYPRGFSEPATVHDVELHAGARTEATIELAYDSRPAEAALELEVDVDASVEAFDVLGRDARGVVCTSLRIERLAADTWIVAGPPRYGMVKLQAANGVPKLETYPLDWSALDGSVARREGGVRVVAAVPAVLSTVEVRRVGGSGALEAWIPGTPLWVSVR